MVTRKSRTSRSALIKAGERGNLSVEESKRLMAMASTADYDPEAAFETAVIELAKLEGWTLRYHTLRSEGSAEGFPDWVLVHERRLRILFVELKAENGVVSRAQARWHAALKDVGDRTARLFSADTPEAVMRSFTLGPYPVYSFIWKPSDWDEICRELGR